jgi:NAD(P)-dependent dehydrogenase (short-subunit alcohol dehydrogenase family)
MERANSRKTCVVTGATSGIGKAVAVELARAGERVVIVCRDPARGEATRHEIDRQTANADTVLVVANLAVLAGMRQAARALLDLCPRLDVLVHNAGVWPTRLQRTPDGFETSFAVNHLAPFVLNHLLRERLLASAPARIVQVTAGLYAIGRIDLDRTPTGDDFHRFRTYASTKQCNLLCTVELARRLADAGAYDGLTVNAVHPGVVRTRLGDMPGPAGLVLRLVKLLWASPATGARGPVRLARDPSLAGTTGHYFDRCRDVPLGPAAQLPELTANLWARSIRYTGLS